MELNNAVDNQLGTGTANTWAKKPIIERSEENDKTSISMYSSNALSRNKERVESKATDKNSAVSVKNDHYLLKSTQNNKESSTLSSNQQNVEKSTIEQKTKTEEEPGSTFLTKESRSEFVEEAKKKEEQRRDMIEKLLKKKQELAKQLQNGNLNKPVEKNQNESVGGSKLDNTIEDAKPQDNK